MATAVDTLTGNNTVEGGDMLMADVVCFGSVGTDDTRMGRVTEATLRGDRRLAATLDPGNAADVDDRLATSFGVSVACTVVVAGLTTVAVPSTDATFPKLARLCARSCLVWMVELPICRVPPVERAWEGTMMRVGVEPVRADNPVPVLTNMEEVGRIASCPRGGTRVEARLVCGEEDVTLGLATCVVVPDCGKVRSWRRPSGSRMIC
jgi:hypothetical protein